MTPSVVVQADAGVLTIRLNRPEKRNAIDAGMYAAMTEALGRADADEAVGAVLLAGGPGAFSAGNDIGDFLQAAEDAGATEGVRAFLRALVQGTKPLVAAVDGLAVGIGTTVLLHCDLVFAAPRSTFRTPFLDLGLVPEAASSLLAPALMGHQRAFALLALGSTFDAEEARAANLVTHSADDPEALAREAARALAAKPRAAMRIAGSSSIGKAAIVIP